MVRRGTSKRSPSPTSGDDFNPSFETSMDTFPYTLNKASSPMPRRLREVDDLDKFTQDVRVGGDSPGQDKSKGSGESKESISDRFDALAVGVLLALLAVYSSQHWPFSRDLLHKTMPFIHSYTLSAPTLGVVAYLVGVHVVDPWYRANVHPNSRKPKKNKDKHEAYAAARDAWLRTLLRAWNLFLTVLSICMLFGIGIPLVKHFAAEGFYKGMCDPDMERWQGPGMFWMWVFCISKFFELIDTLFLTLRDRPINLLHWYHHTTVLVYTWAAIHSFYTPGWLFATVNCSVHTIMYWYYFRRACGVKLSYDKLITTIQIVQMVLGIIAIGIWTTFHLLYGNDVCPSQNAQAMIIAGVVMYGSYFLLFFSFYMKRYHKAKSAKAAKNGASNKRGKAA